MNIKVNTFLGHLWRFLSAVMDWRTHLRVIRGRSIVDVVFITNMRDDVDRKNFLGDWRPKCGHFNGPRYWYKGVVGRTRALDITAEELYTSEGRKKARKLFIEACRWADKRGVRVVLLAASTKRLFNGGRKLKEMFPHIVFTIGDNGTDLVLREETLQTLKKAQLISEYSRIAVLGPYGFLGETMVIHLLQEGYNVVGIGPNNNLLSQVAEKYDIQTFSDLESAGKFDAVIACTHSEKVRINAENVDILRKEGQKLLLIDVAEPSNMRRSEFLKVEDRVVRIDSGNAYSPNLKYVLGAITYKMFRLSRGVTFGCFAETLTIGRAIKLGMPVYMVDWFKVNEENMRLVKLLFSQDEKGFRVPSPRNYSRKVEFFDLILSSSKFKSKSRVIPQLADKIASFMF
jgi:predicted amino acid dehydrogenase